MESLRHPPLLSSAKSIIGRGRISTPEPIPSELSVKQTKRCCRLRCRATMDRRRFTYSGPNFVPHFMQIILTKQVKCNGVPMTAKGEKISSEKPRIALMSITWRLGGSLISEITETDVHWKFVGADRSHHFLKIVPAFACHPDLITKNLGGYF